jgi:hypothetical protein
LSIQSDFSVGIELLSRAVENYQSYENVSYDYKTSLTIENYSTFTSEVTSDLAIPKSFPITSSPWVTIRTKDVKNLSEPIHFEVD